MFSQKLWTMMVEIFEHVTYICFIFIWQKQCQNIIYVITKLTSIFFFYVPFLCTIFSLRTMNTCYLFVCKCILVGSLALHSANFLNIKIAEHVLIIMVFMWRDCLAVISVRNARSSVHSVSSSSDTSSPLDCMNALISSRSDKKCRRIRPLLSHRTSVCSNRSP